MSYEAERQVALEAVVEAAQLCQAVRAELAAAGTLEKSDRSPVTVADFGAQALICRRLGAAFPNDPIVAEEDSSDLRHSSRVALLESVLHYVGAHAPEATPARLCEWIDYGNGSVDTRFWTVDPIDGTKGFLRGDQYAIALALVENGVVQLGVLGCPALPIDLSQPSGPVGSLFAAVRGGGSVVTEADGSRPRPVAVSSGSEAHGNRFVESVESGHGDAERQESVARAVGFTNPPLKLDSQVKYGAIARGDASLYLRFPAPESSRYREKIWDHAAGAVIVEEAGGRVTDMYGRELPFGLSAELSEGAGIVASSGVIHEVVLAALAELG